MFKKQTFALKKKLLVANFIRNNNFCKIRWKKQDRCCFGNNVENDSTSNFLTDLKFQIFFSPLDSPKTIFLQSELNQVTLATVLLISRPRYVINEHHQQEFELRLSGGRDHQEGTQYPVF